MHFSFLAMFSMRRAFHVVTINYLSILLKKSVLGVNQQNKKISLKTKQTHLIMQLRS